MLSGGAVYIGEKKEIGLGQITWKRGSRRALWGGSAPRLCRLPPKSTAIPGSQGRGAAPPDPWGPAAPRAWARLPPLWLLKKEGPAGNGARERQKAAKTARFGPVEGSEGCHGPPALYGAASAPCPKNPEEISGEVPSMR